MKTLFHLSLLSTLIAGLKLVACGSARAQTYKILHSFTPDSVSYYYTNSDGANPHPGLILSGDSLYGTTDYGGSPGGGTLFKINTNGTEFKNLTSEVNKASLISSGNTLYGTALQGSSGLGTVFKVNLDGTGFTNLHEFSDWNVNSSGIMTNTDGVIPHSGLILSDITLYGTAYRGGSSGYGTLFKLNTDGTGFTNLHNFSEKDGVYPAAGLVLSGKILYGVTVGGGDSGNGMVFAVNTDGTGFTNLHSFSYTIDGGSPYASLILSGNTLYGMARDGGSSGSGTVFSLHTDGTGFTNLHNFTAISAEPDSTNTDGATPSGGLVLAGNTLYGTAYYGGSSGNGTVFSLSFRPQLTLTRSETNVILSWPTNVAGFDYTGYTLQSTTNLDSSEVWSTNSPAPVIVNGQNTVTNPISVAQQFYRLSQ